MPPQPIVKKSRPGPLYIVTVFEYSSSGMSLTGTTPRHVAIRARRPVIDHRGARHRPQSVTRATAPELVRAGVAHFGGPAGFRYAVGRRQSEARGLLPERCRGGCRSGAAIRAFPDASGAAQCVGKRLVRRSAANAGAGPRADVRAETADAGRAVDGARTAIRHANFPRSDWIKMLPR